MKLTALLLFFTLYMTYARNVQGQINLRTKDEPLSHVLESIKQQTGYVFVSGNLDLEEFKLSISLHNSPIRAALDSCFGSLLLEYKIVGKTVFIKKKTLSGNSQIKELPTTNTIQEFIVKGIVKDEDGNPLDGATVSFSRTGFNIITTTNQKGMFEIGNVKQGDILHISYVGYLSQDLKASGNFMFIILKPSDNELDKTIVEAYGTTSRRFNVGSISTVDASIIEKQPVLNPLLALEGQVPGLAINAVNGVPGSQVLMQIRGQNSMSTSAANFKPYDQPLIIIDGVPFAAQNNSINQLSSLANQSFSGGISQSGGISPFANINPNDIESISILRDADATSIYGTQGSNGVILITTKKGHPGATTFNLTANTAFNTNARPLKLLNTQQYLQMRKDAFAADGITPSNSLYDEGYAPDLTVFDQNKYTDWQHVIYGKTSHNTDVHGSVSGGSENTSFLISAGYTNADFNYPGGYYDRRWTLHSSLHHVSKDNRFSIDLTNDYGYNKNNSPGGGGKVLLPPNLPDLLDAKGNLVWTYQDVDLSSYQFYSYLKQQANLNNYNMNSALQLGYKIWKGLRLSAIMGYNRNTTSEYGNNPFAAQNPAYAYSSATFSNSANEAINIEPQLNYDVKIGKGVLNALVGGTYKKITSSSTTTMGYGYANDALLGSINGATQVYANDNSNIYKYNAGFGRLKYIYDQKYIISLTGRRDGSSNFGPGRQFGNFGSAGAAWIFSEEKVIKNALPFISYAKLSGDYGTTGSDGNASYKFQPFWSINGYSPTFQGAAPSLPQNLFNPDYSWALKKSLNIALDLGLFNNRILLNTSFYRDREGNQLAGYPLPIQTGFTSVLENLVAIVQNQGWEFSLNSTNIQSKSFTWKTTFNITFNRNKLVAFPNLSASTYSNQYFIGKPTSIIFGYKYKGVNPTTGLFEFYTSSGGVTSAPIDDLASNGGDLVPIGDREVKYMGGFGNTFSYKRFNLYIFFQFSSQMAPTYLQQMYQSGALGTSLLNVPEVVAGQYWTKAGDNASLQRLTSISYGGDANTAAGSFTESSGVYANDTYLRLKTVSLSYTLPESLLKRVHIKDCSIFVNAQNVLTFTNYKVGDPEMFGDYSSMPLQRTVACGLNFNF